MENLLLQLLLTSESAANNSDASLRKLNMCPIAQSFRKDENNDDQIFLNWFTQSTNWLSNTPPMMSLSSQQVRIKEDEENTFFNANQAEFI